MTPSLHSADWVFCEGALHRDHAILLVRGRSVGPRRRVSLGRTGRRGEYGGKGEERGFWPGGESHGALRDGMTHLDRAGLT